MFSLDQVKLVQVKVDEGTWVKANHEEGPLFTVPWMPELYASGLHHIYVRRYDYERSGKLLFKINFY